MSISIGRAAELAGVKVPTIRYYEDIGLLPPPDRTASNRRVYGSETVRRLGFIRQARTLGFDTDAIRLLLALQDDPARSCAEVDRIVEARLTETRERIRSLKTLEIEFERMLDSCTHGSVADCRIIEALTPHIDD